MNKFVNFQQIMKIRGTNYPFLISNTDSFDKVGTHWWGILDIHLKAEIFFFDWFGLDGLKNFVIQDDQKIVQKKGIEKMTKTDNKLTLVKINFSLKAFATLKSGEFESLSKTAQVFFHFIESFGKLHQLKDFVCGCLKTLHRNLRLRLVNLFFLAIFLTLIKIAEYKNITKLQNKNNENTS